MPRRDPDLVEESPNSDLGRGGLRSRSPLAILPIVGPACALALLLVCFRAVLFGGEQFAYRDAAHFYYPLYLRIQQEWNAGRWPLWDPGQNAGMPLLGMPMTAVFYPGKLLYAALSYPWATRLYTIAHVVIAWGGMFALARGLGQSAVAASLAAMAYAFGAPVLFQYCNIIFLVGAAWVPWGLLALERLLHGNVRGGLLGLALVLAFQVLGGDPEAAYLTVLCGGGYALVLAWGEGTRYRGRLWWIVAAAVPLWVVLTLGAASMVPRRALPRWIPSGTSVSVVVWSLVGLVIGGRWWRYSSASRLGPRLAALGLACVLAGLLAAVQLVPVLEYAGHTRRAADGRGDRIYGFDIEPYRVLEAVWPGAYGKPWPEHRSWIQALPPADERLLWTPSLYLGGLTLVLAVGGFGIREGPAWRRWLSLVAVVAVAASFGKFGGPLWVARWLPGAVGVLGPHDPLKGVERIDAFLHDGAGSVYGMLAAALPGFRLFRYPAKVFSFAAAALAVLAGAGWDRLAAGQTQAPRRAAIAALALTLATLGLLLAAREPLVGWLQRRLPEDIEFGPIDPSGALDATRAALVHGGVIFALAAVVAAVAPRRPVWAALLAVSLLALDLAVASAPLVWTAPQAAFDAPSRAAETIANAERANPSAGPFRVHRLEMLYPKGFRQRRSSDRIREVVAWERDTLEPLFGLGLGLEHTIVESVLEIDDYVQFFGGRLVTPRDALGAATGPPLYSFPRRGFDLWNSRYLVMPVAANGWLGAEAGFVRLYPPAEVVANPARAERWIREQNWQLLRNQEAYPRAWIVHFLRVRKPIQARDDPQRFELMKDLVYQADPVLREPGRPLYNPRVIGFVETDEPQNLAGYVSRSEAGPSEKVVITRYEPQRVELTAELERPGLVILADIDYPGWHLTINGSPAPIYRTNRLMRGAAVKAGRHTLVYTYHPVSFRLGGALSIAGLIALGILVPWALAASAKEKASPQRKPPEM